VVSSAALILEQAVSNSVKKHGLLFIVLLIFIHAPSAFAFDLDAPPETTRPLAPFLTFGGNVTLQYQLEKNFDLDASVHDTVSILQPDLALAFSFDPSERVQAFLNIELGAELQLAGGVKDERQTRLEIREAFLLFKELMDGRFFVQVGRQRFDDDRQWLYDQELDAVVALFYLLPRLSLELSASRLNLVDLDFFNHAPKERINNYIVYGNYAIGEDKALAAYAIIRDDQSGQQESPIFFGLHSNGEIVSNLDYWLELAHVLGRDGSEKLRGFGVDVGATYAFDLPLEPAMTLGYAFGTGDDDLNDGVNQSFRQTGLQENEGEFDGVPSFKYYGELVDPELSNLSIFTGGVGIRPTKESSVDLVYHYYLQQMAVNSLRNARIDANPDGSSRMLGSEIDLIAGFEEVYSVELKLVFGYFIPGDAFPARSDSSFLANFEIQYRF